MAREVAPDEQGAELGVADLSLRPGVADDAEALAGLFIAARGAAFPDMPKSIHTTAEIRTWFGALFDTDREVWVAEQDEAIVGYVILDPEWLDSLYVRPDLTGQGIGSALIDLAKGLRPAGFALWVFESNPRAKAFYEGHGFFAAERTDGSDNEEKAPDIKMVWPGAVGELRRRIDEVDDQLATLLYERVGITAEIQRYKTVAGYAGRDPEREAEIVSRMAELAPNLGEARVRQIMHAVITAGLDAVAERDSRT